MLNTPKVRCTGCTACVAACPKSCLRMERDKEGFFYPVAEEAACINCDRCNRGCPAQQMGSKYVQSRMGDCFTRVRLDLEQGRKVLFSGTGCQVQGLLGYLGGPKPGLLTVDVICHGVPSEAVWQAYAKVIGAQLPLSFRDKCTGWQQYSVQLNGTAHPYRQDPYMRLFLSDVVLLSLPGQGCKPCVGSDLGGLLGNPKCGPHHV